VLKDVGKNEKKNSGWDNSETTIKRVNKPKSMLKDETYRAEQKQHDSEHGDDPRPPYDFSGNSLGRVHAIFLAI